MNNEQVNPYEDMEDETLEELRESYQRNTDGLFNVNSRLPLKNREEYRRLMGLIEEIEDEQRMRRRGRPTIADQDTTHYVW